MKNYNFSFSESGVEITTAVPHEPVEIPYSILEEMREAWVSGDYEFSHNSYSYDYLESPAILVIETPQSRIQLPANVWRKILTTEKK